MAFVRIKKLLFEWFIDIKWDLNLKKKKCVLKFSMTEQQWVFAFNLYFNTSMNGQMFIVSTIWVDATADRPQMQSLFFFGIRCKYCEQNKTTATAVWIE